MIRWASALTSPSRCLVPGEFNAAPSSFDDCDWRIVKISITAKWHGTFQCPRTAGNLEGEGAVGAFGIASWPTRLRKGGGARRRVENLLTDILVCEFMGEPNALRLVFDRLSIDNGYFELFYDGLVNCVTLRRYCLVSDLYLTPRLMPRARLVRMYAGARLLPLLMKLTKSSTVHFVERSTTGAV